MCDQYLPVFIEEISPSLTLYFSASVIFLNPKDNSLSVPISNITYDNIINNRV